MSQPEFDSPFPHRDFGRRVEDQGFAQTAVEPMRAALADGGVAAKRSQIVVDADGVA